MSASQSIRSGLIAALSTLLGMSLALSASAQSVATVPVGAITLTIGAASSASSPKYTYLNLPLLNDATYTSKVSAVSSNTITLSVGVSGTYNSTNPHLLRIDTGSNKGTYFTISSNSGSQLTVVNSGMDLSQVIPITGSEGPAVSIIPADTLNSFFGNLVLGGSSASAADQVWVWLPATGQYAKYYYNTLNSRWQEITFQTPSNNTVLRPDSGIVYMRRATQSLDITMTGVVPATQVRPHVRASGYTLASGGFPVNQTLLNMGLHTNVEWIKGTSASATDQVWVWQAGSGQYAKYYYNSNNSRWQEVVFNTNSNSVSIPSGTAFFIKRASATGSSNSLMSIEAPYTL
ncbi:MAG: hypothetical protein K0R17_1219 [Rariglobus sp.]|jgi:hypothetical protein|nr:hypothetical protein [Rariglobus sp.]